MPSLPDHHTIGALAKGLVPFVREVVTDAVTPLTARLAELEARPIEKGEPGAVGAQGEAGPPGSEGPVGPKGEAGDPGSILLPPELVEQVASAVRMLHEAPPIVAPLVITPKVKRIERDEDGNFVPVYEGTQP